MKKILFLAFAGLFALQASAQLNIQNSVEVEKPVFSYGGYLEIKQTNNSYLFEYYDAVTQAPKTFTMDNKQSAQELLDLAVKMYERKDPKESYMFRKPNMTYKMQWEEDKLILYIMPDYGHASSWNLKHYILETVKL